MVALVLASAALRFVASLRVSVPWIAPDEPIYGLLGRSLYQHGTLDVLGGPTPYYSAVYPLLVGPAMLVHDLALGIHLLQLLQALLMSATAALVYVWSRPVAGARWALVAAGLSVAIPGMAYAGLVMTEAAAYPSVTLALVVLARTLARPSLAAQAAVLATCALACGIRLQALVLLPTVAGASLLSAWFARDRAMLRTLAPLLAVVAGTMVLGGLLVAAGAAPLGAYSTTVGHGYELGAVARQVSWHAGDLSMLVATVPLVALVALAVPAIRGREPDRRVRALVAVALTYVPLLVLQVGTFASRFVDHLAERDLLSSVPPLLVVFVVWLRRGVPRPQPWTSLAAFAVAATGVLLPISRLTTQATFLDSFNAIALRRLAEHTSEDLMRTFFAAGVAAFAAAAVLVPRRRVVVLPIAVGAVLVASSAVASVEIPRLSQADERWWFGDANPAWIDEAADGRVTYVHAGTHFWGGVWKHVFWNRRIDAVARLPDAPLPGPIRSAIVAVRFDGTILTSSGAPLHNRLLVVPYGLRPAGRRLAGIGPSSDQPGLELWRVAMPPRVRLWTHGVALNGDFQNAAGATVYDCRGGRLALTLLGKTGAPVVVRVDGRPVRRLRLPPDETWSGEIPVDPSPGSRICRIELTSEGLVGSTKIEYVAG